jgi:hypothetical protein
MCVKPSSATACLVKPVPEPSYRLVQEIQPGHRRDAAFARSVLLRMTSIFLLSSAICDPLARRLEASGCRYG